MKIIKVPCTQCGTMISVLENQKGQKNYCDKFCKSRAQVVKSRGGNKPKSPTNTPKRRKRCRSCGG